MRFMDKKEEVLDLQLTPWGEYLLSLGKFKPAYYSFHDNNVLYDSRRFGVNAVGGTGWATATRDIQKRVQDETPQPRTQTVFRSSETYTTTVRIPEHLMEPTPEEVAFAEMIGLDPDMYLTDYAPRATFIDESTFSATPQKVPYYCMSDVLGKTDKLTKERAAWKVYYLNGELTGSTAATTTQAEPTTLIPQLSSSVEYTISLIDDPKFKSDFELAVQFPDGKTLDIRPDYMLLSFEEDSSRYVNDKFELEVFEVEDLSLGDYQTFAPGETSPTTNSRSEERLRKIYFTKKVEVVENNLLLEDSEINARARQAEGQYPSDSLTSTYFDILADNEIEESVLRNSLDFMKSKGFYVDVGLTGAGTTGIALVDIYETDSAYREVCPELDDDCPEEEG